MLFKVQEFPRTLLVAFAKNRIIFGAAGSCLVFMTKLSRSSRAECFKTLATVMEFGWQGDLSQNESNRSPAFLRLSWHTECLTDDRSGLASSVEEL